MTLLPDQPVHMRERYYPVLVDSSWVILDLQRGQRASKVRYTVEIQAQWTAEMLNAAYQDGLKVGRELTADG
jgi:hypothetical protein